MLSIQKAVHDSVKFFSVTLVFQYAENKIRFEKVKFCGKVLFHVFPILVVC